MRQGAEANAGERTGTALRTTERPSCRATCREYLGTRETNSHSQGECTSWGHVIERGQPLARNSSNANKKSGNVRPGTTTAEQHAMRDIKAKTREQ